jgi:hypothetical protein
LKRACTGYQAGTTDERETAMSFDRPGPDTTGHTVSDTELNDALENDRLDKGTIDIESVEHDEGRRSPGPEPDPRRDPEQDTTSDGLGGTAEPPD